MPDRQALTVVRNPVLWADVPDPDVIRIGDCFYMVSTTMHLTPGAPIMRSFDLAHWETVSYVYDVLENEDAHSLANGHNSYGRGSWAASLRFHDGLFLVCFASYDEGFTGGRTYLYRTADLCRGPWERFVLPGVHHDPSLLFDDDGRVYLVYGAGEIRIRELTKDATAFLEGGVDRSIILTPREGNRVNAEGSHACKINDWYYVFLIQWPASDNARRIQWCYRSRNLLESYEGRVVLNDDLGYRNQGVAQGGVFDTPDGDWYTMLFQDHGAVGRVPVLVPVTWADGWPELGIRGRAAVRMTVPLSPAAAAPLVTSDDFNQGENRLGPAWQWNHNPDPMHWSLTERPGCLRLTTGDVRRNILQARNTLSQRTEGPACSGETLLHTASLKPGDWAGLAAFQNAYGLIGVRVSDEGTKSVVMAVNDGNGDPEILEEAPLAGDSVYLKVDFDFDDGRDRASFFHSNDGSAWRPLGAGLDMRYTLDHFMGYRIALFNYATQTAGGRADFDHFRYARRE